VTLPSDTEILITREFDAPRRLVYRAWTTPELVRRWWSGHRGEMTVAEIDLRVGAGGAMDSGMEVGMQEQMDLLEELARSLR
jgi:uncharacterized protein YndB with AHSA1/START domain